MKSFVAVLVNKQGQAVTVEVEAKSFYDAEASAKERWIIDTLSDAHDYEVEDVGAPMSSEKDIHDEWRNAGWHVVYVHEFAEGKVLTL